jgi:hypothetical protein
LPWTFRSLRNRKRRNSGSETQTDKKILAAVEEGNELAEDGNDMLDEIAANTQRLVPGGWVKTGGSVLSSASGVFT